MRFAAGFLNLAMHALQHTRAGANPAVAPPRVHKVVLVRMNGTGSSTLVNILHRLCATYRLGCFLPTRELHGKGYADLVKARQGRTGQRSIFTDNAHRQLHVFPDLCELQDRCVFQPRNLDALVPGITKIAIFRHPVDRILSVYSRQPHGIPELARGFMSGEVPESGCASSMVSRVPTEQFHALDFVLLLEKIDVGLVMMRRLFGWRLRDIIYVRLGGRRSDRLSKELHFLKKSVKELDGPTDDLNDFMAKCLAGDEMRTYRMAQKRWHQQWDALGTKGQIEVREETHMFEATLQKVRDCCQRRGTGQDWFCSEMLETDQEWAFRNIRAGLPLYDAEPAQSACVRLVPD